MFACFIDTQSLFDLWHNMITRIPTLSSWKPQGLVGWPCGPSTFESAQHHFLNPTHKTSNITGIRTLDPQALIRKLLSFPELNHQEQQNQNIYIEIIVIIWWLHILYETLLSSFIRYKINLIVSVSVG